MRLGAVLLLAGCGSNISNAAFLEDAEFLAALPDAEHVGAPVSWQADPGDSACKLLADGHQAAIELDEVGRTLLATTDALRGEPADERSDVHRAWTDVTVAADAPGGVWIWHVDAEIVRTSTQFSWTIHAVDGDVLGDGTLADEGGEGTWDLTALGELLDDDELAGRLEIETTDHTDLRLIGASGLEIEAAWATFAETGLGWSGTFDVAADGDERLGYAVAVTGEVGGRAQGLVFDTDGGEYEFDACWNGDGALVYQGGDEEIGAEGGEGSCTVSAFGE